MISYIERKLYIQTPAIDLLMAIARSGLYTNYTLYEQPHEWAMALGNLASIRATADTVTLFSEDQYQRFSRPRLSDAIAEATAALPVKDWRLYGCAQFELSHIFHGIKSTRIATDQPLLELFVPQCEIRIEQQHLLLRATTPQKLEALQHLIEQVDTNPSRPSLNQMTLAYQNIAAYQQDQYRQAVQQAVLDIKEHRYQKVIMSRQIPLKQPVDILESYQTGRRNNTPARSFIYSQGGFMAAGFSPETVVEVGASGWVSTQPLAGTRAIGANKAEEARLKAELLADTKEIAEHAISVKLAIEELELVCDANSLSVSEFMAIRRRGSVQHLASRVKGQLAEGKNCWDAFEALFPAVTASGIPKKPAIEAIQRLEHQNRGLYSGCIMITDSQGSMDAALVLRSIYNQHNQQWLQAGAGIVDQSKPDRELEETIEKLTCIMTNLVAKTATATATDCRSKTTADQNKELETYK
ncbi:salicylate synthase [Photobacterium sanguinicancri]|uniref:Salicylate synthase n=1 Tax=Photobacterium sanguinicancri TaxID=875932 RepID=A0ABX4G4M0_9GAMM|nr:salicylate synthase [Photobacterium sanguinicancri]OZS45967.1 salicylate synthase [Photobacterium sanguinicancri]